MDRKEKQKNIKHWIKGTERLGDTPRENSLILLSNTKKIYRIDKISIKKTGKVIYNSKPRDKGKTVTSNDRYGVSHTIDDIKILL